MAKVGITTRAARFLAPAVIVLATMATYYGVIRCEFLSNWDDAEYILQNPYIRGFTWDNLRVLFSRAFLGNYAPVHLLSYMLEFSLWGLDPRLFHLTNLALHISSGLLLYFLALRMDLSRPAATGAALIFLLHPVQIESVAWISQRKNLLAMLFFLVAFHCYIGYTATTPEQRRRRQMLYLLSLGAFAVSLLSKSVAVILPPVLLLYDFCLRKGRPARWMPLLLEKVPFGILAIAGAIGTMATQSVSSHGGMIDADLPSRLKIMITMITVLQKYLGLLLWPAKLSIFYSFPLVQGLTAGLVIAMLLLIAMIAAGVLLARRAPKLFFWYSLFFIGLLPVSQIVPIITLINDRYLYFPMLGASVCISAGAASLFEKAKIRHTYFVSFLVIVTAMLAIVSHERVKVWRNSVVLWEDAVEKAPDNPAVWVGLGNAYEMGGNNAQAVAAIKEALRLNPQDRSALMHASLLYRKIGMRDKARSLALQVVALYPQYVPGLLTVGENFAEAGEHDKARDAFNKVLVIEQGNPEALQWLSWLDKLPATISGKKVTE